METCNIFGQYCVENPLLNGVCEDSVRGGERCIRVVGVVSELAGASPTTVKSALDVEMCGLSS